MNKTVLIFLLALYSVSAFTQWGGKQHRNTNTPRHRDGRQIGQMSEALADILSKKYSKNFSQYGNKIANQYAGQYANQDPNKYANQYGKDYVDQGKSMTRLGKNGQGKKYGEDQSALSHSINKEYTDKYTKGKDNQNDQWKKYQEKYQHDNEEEDNLKNEEESAFIVDDLFIGLTWM